MAEVTVKPYQPKLTPVDYDPFYDATGADKPAAQPETVKLAGASLFSDLFKGLKPSDFNPALSGTPGSMQKAGESFMEGARKSGHAGLESMATALENQYVPEGAVKFDDSGQYFDKDNNPLPTQYRPNILPVTKKPDGGIEGAMPAMLDVWNTLGGPGGLGAGPSLRPALKYMDKIYKAKPGQQHLDALPPDLLNTFQKQALSGEDISNFNFGFMNHKGHFMSREDALKYAIDNGILDPNDAKFKTLVTTMLNQSGGEGKLVSQAGAASKENAPAFYSALEKALGSINQSKASGEQWISTLANRPGVKGEELDWVGLKDFLKDKKNVTKAEIEDYIKNNRVEIGETWKGGKQYPYREAHEWENAIYRAELKGDWAKVDELNKAWEHYEGFGPKGETKYSEYQLPGGENYRELLMTLPNKLDEFRNTQKVNDAKIKELRDGMKGTSGSNEIRSEISKLQNENQAIQQQIRDLPLYKSSHWDEPNILAHMRMNDRTIDGKKSLHLEEIQSDWHQQGREKGYKGSIKPEDFGRGNFKEIGPDGRKVWEFQTSNGPYLGYGDTEKDAAKFIADIKNKRGLLVPDAPFKKTWHELALKRAIREAAENGYERLSWTPGDAQAARYDLSKQVDKIKLIPDETILSGKKINYRLEAYKNNERKLEQYVSDENELSSIVGKEVAKKLIENKNKHGASTLEGEQLSIGGEGMKGFYDQIIPKSIEKIAKEFGVKVKKGRIKATDMPQSEYDKYPDGHPYKEKNNPQIFYIDIPEAMRQKVMKQGQPLFSGTPTLVPVSHTPEFEEETK